MDVMDVMDRMNIAGRNFCRGKIKNKKCFINRVFCGSVTVTSITPNIFKCPY